MKWIKHLIWGLAAAVLLFLVANFAFIWTMAHWQPELKEADAVIVLGAAINTPALYNRTSHGLKIYQDGLVDLMVFSGGKISDSDISEAEYMAKLARQQGVYSNFLIEDQSGNTFENIRNSKRLLSGRDSVIIVSDDFHLARAVMLAKRAGFKDVQWSSPSSEYYSSQSLRYYYSREFFAMISYLPIFIFGE